jgi:hypothetical protein
MTKTIIEKLTKALKNGQASLNLYSSQAPHCFDNLGANITQLLMLNNNTRVYNINISYPHFHIYCSIGSNGICFHSPPLYIINCVIRTIHESLPYIFEYIKNEQARYELDPDWNELLGIVLGKNVC